MTVKRGAQKIFNVHSPSLPCSRVCVAAAPKNENQTAPKFCPDQSASVLFPLCDGVLFKLLPPLIGFSPLHSSPSCSPNGPCIIHSSLILQVTWLSLEGPSLMLSLCLLSLYYFLSHKELGCTLHLHKTKLK